MKRTDLKFRKSAEELRRIQELRRSNAAQPMANKKAYSRKEKYKNYDFS